MVDRRDLVAGEQGIARRRLGEAGRTPRSIGVYFASCCSSACAAKQLAESPCPDGRPIFRADGVRARTCRSPAMRARRSGDVGGGEAGERLLDAAVGAVEGEPAISGHQRRFGGIALVGRVGAPARRAVIVGRAGGAGDAEFEARPVDRRIAAADRAAPFVEAVGLVVIAVADAGEAAGGGVLAAQQHAEVALGEAARQALDMGAVAAALDGRGEPRLALRLARDDVDDAAHGVGAVDRALRPAQHLDALDIVERDRREIELVADRRRVVDAHAVDEHQRVADVAAAQAHFGRPPGPPDSVTVTPGTVCSRPATEVGDDCSIWSRVMTETALPAWPMAIGT